VQLKTKNGKCDVNCGYFSAKTGCYAGWEVGKDCPGDMTINEPTEQVPVILTDDGPIIFEEKTYKGGIISGRMSGSEDINSQEINKGETSSEPEPFVSVTSYIDQNTSETFVGQYTDPKPKKRGRKPNVQ
jgi:hypothetical protein